MGGHSKQNTNLPKINLLLVKLQIYVIKYYTSLTK
jgi:hypothetical protein